MKSMLAQLRVTEVVLSASGGCHGCVEGALGENVLACVETSGHGVTGADGIVVLAKRNDGEGNSRL